MKALEDWQSITLGEVCRFIGGNGFREELQGRKDGDYPFIKVSDMELPGNKKMIVQANNWIDEKTRKNEAFKAFPETSVVFAKVGAALLLNRRRILTRPTCIDNNMMAAVPNGIDPLFLYYVLSDIDFADFVQSGAVPSINQGQISGISFDLPKPNEQTKIAEILSTVDRAIEQTEALIAKQQRIKTGLMQDLLTRGIDENGNLRSEQTHKFKDSPLGRIPVEWETASVSSVLAQPPKNGYSPVESNNWNGIYMLGLGCLTAEGFKPNQLKYAPKTDRRIEGALLLQGDFLISRSNTRALVGLVGIIRALGEPCIYPDLMVRLQFGVEVSVDYMEQVFMSPAIRRQIETAATGTSGSMVKISAAVIKELLFSKPPIEEQLTILSILHSKAEGIRKTRSSLAKLRSLKTALMQDLLTGKKRVTPLLNDKEVMNG